MDQGTTRELVKYVTKLSDLVGDVVALDKFLTAVHKKRFVRTYGSFYGLSVADEENPAGKPCPDCDSKEIVMLGRVKPQQVSIDFNGVMRVERPPREVDRDFAEAESFRPGLFVRHKYAPRPGHERTPRWAEQLDDSVRKFSRRKFISSRQPAA